MFSKFRYLFLIILLINLVSSTVVFAEELYDKTEGAKRFEESIEKTVHPQTLNTNIDGVVVQDLTGKSAIDLARYIVGDNIEIKNVKFTGVNRSAGFFTAPYSIIGFSERHYIKYRISL